jgi:hypothetical protein
MEYEQRKKGGYATIEKRMVRQEVKERQETKGRNISRRLIESSTGANREKVYTRWRERWFDTGEASGICSSDST